MFRIAKQLEISRLIHECETTQEIFQWFKVIVNHIGVQQGRKIVANAFLKCKSQFDNQIIDDLLASKQIGLYEEDGVAIAHNKINDISNQMTNKQNKPRSKLGSLPEGVFFRISFYLTTKSCLHLSMTSHSFHKKIQNNKCFYTKPATLLCLNPITLNTIVQNNCIRECAHVSTSIDIKTVNNYPYSSFDCTNCPLSRLIHQINSDKNINYDLLWFKKIWNNMTGIYISNHYRCALKHIPISWIIEQDINTNQVSKPIEVFGAASHGQQTSRRRTYIDTAIIENFCKRVERYINNNPDKKMRKIQRIWYDREFDMIKIHSSFGNNLTGIILDLPRLWDNKCRFQDLDTFFRVFHENVNWLEICIDSCNMGTHNIISQLFKNNKQLCHDLNKTEEELAFNQFLKKYNCQNKLMPQIRDFVIGLNNIVPYEKSVLSKLLDNDKILKLLNIQKSVNCLWFTFKYTKNIIKHKSDIEHLNQLAISKLDNLDKCLYTKIQDQINESQLINFFRLANQFLLQMVLKPKGKHVLLQIQTPKWTHRKILNYTIKIENKQELLYCNRDALRKKISSIVDNSVQAARRIWYKTHLVKIEQRFQLERGYSI